MIFEGQDHIHQSINGINKRLNEIVGLSQQVSNQVSQISSGAVAAPQVCSVYFKRGYCFQRCCCLAPVYSPRFLIAKNSNGLRIVYIQL